MRTGHGEGMTPGRLPSDEVRRGGMALRTQILAVVVVASCLILGVLSSLLLQERRDARQAAGERMRAALGEFVARELEMEHEGVRLAAALGEATAGLTAEAMRAGLEHAKAVSALPLDGLYVSDANGTQLARLGDALPSGTAEALHGRLQAAPLGRGVWRSGRDPHGRLRIFAFARTSDSARLVVLALDPQHALRTLTGRFSGSATIFGIINSDGEVLLRIPDVAKVTGKSIRGNPMFEAARRTGFTQMVAGESVEGSERLAVYAGIDSAPGSWIFTASEPIEVVYGGAPRLLSYVAGLFVALLLLVAVLFWRWLSRGLVAPLEQLATAARKLGRGDLSARTGLQDAPLELRKLGTAFDEMARSLQRMDETVRANRALRVLVAVKATRDTGEGDAALLQRICAAAGQAASLSAAYVLRVRHDDAKTLEPVAAWGIDLDALRHPGYSWGDGPLGQGVSGRAAREGKVAFRAGDGSDSSPDHPRREAPHAHKLRSAMSIPILLGGEPGVWGVFTLGSSEDLVLGAAEADLLAESALDIAAKLEAAADRRARHEAEAQLQAREAVFTAIADQSDAAIALVDPGTWRFLEFNAAAAAMVGYSSAEFARLRIRDIEEAMTDGEITSAVQQALRPEGVTLETQLRRKDGSVVHVRISARPLVVRGRPLLATIWQDISDSRRALEQLTRMAREQRMLAAANRAVLRASEVPAMLQEVCDVLVHEGKYRMAWFGRVDHGPEKRVEPVCWAGDGADYVRKADITWADAPRGMGPSGVAVRTKRPHALQNVAEDPAFAPWREAALAKGYAACCAVPLLDRSQDVRYAVSVYSESPFSFDLAELDLLANLAENAAFAMQVLEDRAALHSAEAEKAMLWQAIEQSPESIAITDLAGKLEYVNPAFLTQTGYSREDVMGANPRVLKSGKTPPEAYAAMWTALTQGYVWQGEFINRRKDGSEYTEAATIGPVRDEAGQLTHYLAIKTDISEQKRAQAELQRHRLHLEELVAERTAELVDARRRAEEANRAKSAFLANMSHEIRTPMNAILGMAHLLEQADPTPGQAERLRKITRAARHLLSIVNDILDLYKIEAGKLHVEAIDFRLAEALHAVRDSLADRAAEKGLRFDVELATDLPPLVVGDPVRLQQILLNLGSNAVKFTSAGSVRIRVQRADSTEPGTAGKDALPGPDEPIRVRCEVTDTGIGLTPAQVARVFEPFEQADDSTTRRFGGTGLGLAICRRLVELVGGTLGVNSEPGRGSTFWVEVPYRMPALVDPLGATQRNTTMLRAVPVGVRAADVRVLVVEDDAMNQEVAVELLRSRGFSVEVAAHGADALAKAQATSYQLVLMDVQMPVMDGLAATRALRAIPAYEQTPILATTASAFAEEREACLSAGMDDIVTKPIDPDVLFAALTRWTGVATASQLQTPQTRTPPTWLAQLHRVRGLQPQVGLRAVQGDSAHYARLLRSFAADRADAVEVLHAQWLAGAVQDARRQAHTLKGLLGTLGATDAQRAAAAVETALGADDGTALAAALGDLADTLAALVHGIRAALPDDACDIAALPVDWVAARRVLTDLRALLADDDALAVEVFHQNAALLCAAMGAEPGAALTRALNGFQFDVALTWLDAAVAAEPRLRAESA